MPGVAMGFDPPSAGRGAIAPVRLKSRLYGLLILGLGLGAWRLWHGHWDPRCDPAYGVVCIPRPPSPVQCSDLTVNNFRVYLPVHRHKPWGLRQFDPQGLDPDGDGYGCEAGGPLADLVPLQVGARGRLDFLAIAAQVCPVNFVPLSAGHLEKSNSRPCTNARIGVGLGGEAAQPN